jgi:hypothetical protein
MENLDARVTEKPVCGLEAYGKMNRNLQPLQSGRHQSRKTGVHDCSNKKHEYKVIHKAPRKEVKRVFNRLPTKVRKTLLGDFPAARKIH